MCITCIRVCFLFADVEFNCPILKVVHNTANDNFTKNGVMVKGTIVEVDSNSFKTWSVLSLVYLVLIAYGLLK